MKKIFIILLLINLIASNANSIEADVFVQSTVNRASEILSKNISREEKINGNFVCSFEVKQIDENLRDRFLNQLLESHKAIIFQTKEKGTELFTLP